MKDKIPLSVDIPLPVDVVTGETCSRIVQKVIEVLLYQRNQIPFCYDTFRTIVAKFDREKESDEEQPDWMDYRLVKQRDAAIDALARIRELFKELPTVTSHGSSVMILFGSTVYTAKEAFQVDLPPVNPDHHPDIHRTTLESALKQLAMTMTLSEELQTGREIITGPTKMFLLLKRSEQFDLEPGTSWQRMEDFRLPVSCRRHMINLLRNNSSDQRKLTCCKEMVIFSEEKEEVTNVATMDVEKQQAEDGGEAMESVWYQIGEGLKGYKDVEVKGKLIWNCGS